MADHIDGIGIVGQRTAVRLEHAGLADHIGPRKDGIVTINNKGISWLKSRYPGHARFLCEGSVESDAESSDG